MHNLAIYATPGKYLLQIQQLSKVTLAWWKQRLHVELYLMPSCRLLCVASLCTD